MSEAKLRWLLFQCLCELFYVQSVEHCNTGMCATPMGKELIDEGIKALGIPDLHEREEEKLRAAAGQETE